MEITKMYKKEEFEELKNEKKSLTSIYKYLFVIIYYFLIIDIILGALLLPLARKNIVINDLTAATSITDSISYDKDGLGFIKYDDYEELKDLFSIEDVNGNMKDIIIAVGIVDFMIEDLEFFEYSTVTQNTYVLLANYKNKNLTHFYKNDEIDLEYLTDIITGKVSTYKDGSKINFYYNPTYYYNETFSDINHFKGRNDFETNFGIIHNLIYYLLLALPLLIIFINPLISAFKELFKSENLRAKIVPSIFIALGVGIGAGLLSNLVKVAVGLPDGAPLNQKGIEEMMGSSLAILLVLTVVILGPFVEEVVFRKSFFGLIKNKWIALAASSLLFTFIHVSQEPSLVYSLVNSISYLGGGLAFGIIYLKNEKNIALVILAHSFYNLISVLPLLF